MFLFSCDGFGFLADCTRWAEAAGLAVVEESRLKGGGGEVLTAGGRCSLFCLQPVVVLDWLRAKRCYFTPVFI